MKKLEIIFLFLIILSSSVWATTYTATKPKDLDLTTPTESNTKVSEFNNSDREIKTVIVNLENITTVTGTYTVAGTQTGILGSSTSAFTISFPSASSLATGSITKRYNIKNINTGTITLNLTVDGVGSPTVTGSQTFKLYTDGTSWFEERANTAANASNAGLLDNLDSTYFTNATNLSTGTVNLDRIPGTLTGKSADLLDEQTGSYYTNASNLDSGTIPLARIPTTLTGKDADTLDTVDSTSFVQISRTISTTAPLAGGGALSSNLTLSIPLATSGQNGYISATDWTTFNNKLSSSRILYATTPLTIGGGASADLSADRTIAMATATTSQDGFVRKEDFQLFSNKANIVAGSGITSSSTTGTTTIMNNGVLQIIAGTGISASNNGTGSVTLTSVGTTTAGGWLDTGTASVGSAGYPIIPHGTITVDTAYGITGILDRDIPNTIVLDNLTQITTRNYDDLSGTATIKPTQIAVGTSTLQGAVNVSGTVTASGFSGNGAGLTNLPVQSVAFSEITGIPTGNSYFSEVQAENKVLYGIPDTFSLPGTVTTFGTTTQHNNSILTINGSATSPISIIGTIPPSYSGTNTTAIMTGTSTPAPNIVLASNSNGSTFAAYLAFDGVLNASNRWATDQSAAWLRYDYGTDTTRIVATYNVASAEPTYGIKDWTFEGSNNATSWSILDTQAGITGWSTNVYKSFNISIGSQSAYQFYRLNITANQGSGYSDIVECQLIARIYPSANVFYINGSGTVLVGTNTSNSTSTAYIFQVAGSGLGTSWGVTCYEAIKSIVGSGSDVIAEGYNAVMGTKLFKHHPKIRDDITLAHAEGVAKSEYVASFIKADFETFKADRLGSYTTYAANGSSTVDWKKFNNDFQTQYVEPRKDEFYVLPDMDKRINDKKVDLESDTSITNITPISDNTSTSKLFKRSDSRILELQPQVGCLQAAAQYQDIEIKELKALVGSLTSRINKAGIP